MLDNCVADVSTHFALLQPMADSLSIFAEGTFKEQILELAKYLSRPDNDTLIRALGENFIVPEGGTSIADDEAKRKSIIKLLVKEINGLGEGTDRETEGFYNLVYCHVLALYPPDSADSTELVTSLITAITFSSPTDRTPIKYKLLSNLFNALPNRSTLRHLVYKALLDLAIKNEELEVLQLKLSDVDKWVEEWDISMDEKSDFIKSISDAYAKLEQPETSYSYQVAYVKSIPSSSPKVEASALAVIATALKLHSVFNFDALLKIGSVRVVKDHPLFFLLKIMLEGGIPEYQSWLAANEAIVNEFGLDKNDLERKVRLIVLADLGSRNIGRDIPYHEIASALQIDQSQVEACAIDAIRSRLLSGRLSQPNETFQITRSTCRSFGKEEWETVEKRLTTWKTGLQGVLEVIANARKTAAGTATARTSLSVTAPVLQAQTQAQAA